MSGEIITNNNLPTVPILIDPETGWLGAGPDGKTIADQESFSYMFGWGGTDQLGSGESQTRWLRTELMMRSMAWQGSLYESFIVWVFIVRNPTDQPIVDMSMGVHADHSFFPSFIQGIGQDDDRYHRP